MTFKKYHPPHIYLDDREYYLTASTFNRELFFSSGEQKRLLRDILKEKIQAFSIKLYAWVILDNHYHLLIRVAEKETLYKFVQSLHGVSSFRLNQRENRKGRRVWRNYWDRCPRSEEDFYTFFNYIHISAKHLLHLIDSILDLSKIESGKMTLEPTEFDLAVLLEDVKVTVLPMLTTKKQTLQIEIGDGISTIFADEAKLKQIFLNLISNAHKFTLTKGKIKVICQLGTPHLLHSSVIDNGIGISPQDQQRIFEEFGQVKTHPSVKGRGVGLGLSIAKRLVELHGGKIWVISEPGCGSSFTFSIPLARKGSA